MAELAEVLKQVKAHGPGLSSAVLDQEAKFTIEFKDSEGQLIETEAELSVEILGPKKIDPNITYNDDGTFSVRYTPVTPGEYTIAVKLNEENIQGSPYKVIVAGLGEKAAFPADSAATPPPAAETSAAAPAPVLASNSSPATASETPAGSSAPKYTVTATGSGLREATLGRSAYFELQLKDETGAYVSNVPGLQLTIDGPKAVKPPVIRESRKGVVLVEWQPAADGRYEISLTVAGAHIAGSPYSVSVSAPSAPAAASAVAEAEPPRKPRSQTLIYTVTGAGTKECVAGKPARFEIHCKDEHGVPQTSLAKLEVSFSGPRSVYAPAVNEDPARRGVYFVEYRVVVPGTYQMSVTADGKDVEGSPFTVQALPKADAPAAQSAAPAPSSSASTSAAAEPAPAAVVKPPAPVNITYKLVGASSRETVAGRPSRFELEARDENGVLVPGSGSRKIEVSFSGPRSVYAPAVNEDPNRRGIYFVEYQIVSAGTYQMTVTVNGEPIPGSPFTVIAHPKAADGKEEDGHPPAEEKKEALPTVPLKSSAAGSAGLRYSVVGAGAKSAVAGKTAKFEINSRDENGLLAPSLAKFEVSFTGPRPVYAPEVKPHPDMKGVYLVEYQTVVPGTYHMTVTADGQPIEGSPFEITVTGLAREQTAKTLPEKKEEEALPTVSLHKTGAAQIRYSAVGAGLREAVSGKTAKFEIHARDENGLLVPSLAKYEVSFTGPRPVYAPDVKPHPELKGVYVVEYQTVAPGTYHMTVTADGKPIEGSPFEVTVSGLAREQSKIEPKREEEKESLPTVHLNRPSGPQIKYSVAPHGSINGHKEATAGKPAKFEIHARDENGLLTPTKAKIAVSFQGPRPVYAPSVTESYTTKGLFIVEYQVVSAGIYQMTVTVDGQPIEGSPFEVRVSSPSGDKPAPSPAPAATASASDAANQTTVSDRSTERFKWDASGPGLLRTHAGKVSKFFITAKDKTSRPLQDLGLEVNIDGPEKVSATIEDQGKGSYLVMYKVQTPGVYKIAVTAFGGHISKSPYTVNVKPATSAKKTVIENWYFTVKARTEAGDEQEDGDDDFKVEVVGPTEVNAKVKDLGNGEYFVSYSLTQRGDYTINVTLNGEHVAGSPYHQKF